LNNSTNHTLARIANKNLVAIGTMFTAQFHLLTSILTNIEQKTILITIDKTIMIEELKNTQVEDNIILLDEQVMDFFEEEKLTVTGVSVYSSDDAEMIIIEMDEFYLVAHSFESEERYFAYQLIDEGDTNDLEGEGYKFLNDDNDFRHKIVIREDGKAFVYHPSDTGAIYGINKERSDGDDFTEPQEVSICEFVSSSARLKNILIKREDDYAYIMQGFEIDLDNFEVQKSE
jgi:hypothetical protein